MIHRRSAGRPIHRSPWVSAISAAATATLVAVAIGAPVAMAATRDARPASVAAVDPATTDPVGPLGSVGPTDPAPVPSVSDTPAVTSSPSVSDTPSASNSTGPTPSPTDPSSSSTATPSPSDSASPTTGTIEPQTQLVRATVGSAIDPTQAFTTSDEFVDTISFSVEPSLPDGLSMSRTTGVVKGTPRTAQRGTWYTVTADDGTVTASARIAIAVAPIVTPAKQSITGTIFDTLEPSKPLTPLGFPDAKAVTFSIDPKLPDGIAIDPETGIVSGYAITLEKATVYVITAADGAFTATSDLVLTTTCPDVYTPQPLPVGCPAVAPIAAQSGGVSPSLLAAVAQASDPVHGPLADPANADTCALCHRTHSAKQSGFLGSSGVTQTALCFSCHNGTGGGPNIQAQYAAAPANAETATSRTYFSHDVAATKAHQGAIIDEDGGERLVDEFGGVLNRHAECSDCHNPHASYIDPPTTNVSTLAPAGWTASGLNYATTGVEADYAGVTAGGSPAFSLLDGVVQPLTAEYQLCFKCHSSYTQLPSNAGMNATSQINDQAVEFNPANPSFHPVTKQGTNQTAAMKNSLLHASGPKLLWNFKSTDTIRCTSCHAEPTVSNSKGGAGQASAPHASFNKFILLRRYEAAADGTSAVSGSDYDLCFGCHSQGPFTNEGSADTNWGDHFKHVGESDLRCAECHGDIHSTTTTAGTVGNTRLMQFSANARAYRAGTPLWAPVITGGVQNGGSCALVCHGKTHTGSGDYRYTYTP